LVIPHHNAAAAAAGQHVADKFDPVLDGDTLPRGDMTAIFAEAADFILV
jgi:hypothetical protein